jgi:hypothetical protein
MALDKARYCQKMHVSVYWHGTGNDLDLHGIESATNQFIDLVYSGAALTRPNFVAKFTKGDLQYFAVAHPYTDINDYTYEEDPFTSKN